MSRIGRIIRYTRFRPLPIKADTVSISQFSSFIDDERRYSLFLQNGRFLKYPHLLLLSERKINVTGDIFHIKQARINRRKLFNREDQDKDQNRTVFTASLPSLDPDLQYLTDDISTSASLSAFASFEVKQRMKKQIKQRSNAEISTETSAAPDNRINQSIDGTSLPLNNQRMKDLLPLTSNHPIDPDIVNAEDDLSAVSMDAFAQMEIKLAKQRKLATGINSKTHDTSPPSSIPITSVPVPPEAWECCGHDCPNCVWIVYAEKLAAYEEQISKD